MIRRVQRIDLARGLELRNRFSEPLGSPEMHPTKRGLAPRPSLMNWQRQPSLDPHRPSRNPKFKFQV